MVATATATMVFQTLARALTGVPAVAAPTAVQMATTATVAPVAMEAMEVRLKLAIKTLQYDVAALLPSYSTALAVEC